MAVTPTTLQVMLTLLRQRTNMENNQFVTDAELTSYLNNSLCLLDGILVSKFSDYKLTKAIVSVNAGTNIISLPSDFLKLRGLDVWMRTIQDGYRTLSEYTNEERNKYTFPAGGNTFVLPYHYQYRLEGNQLTIIPANTAGNYSYRLHYTPDYIPLVNTTDALQSYMDSQAWYQYAVYDAAAQVLAKQDLDPSFFLQQANMLREHLIKLATPNRNAGEPKQVSARGEVGGFPYGWDW